MHIKTQNKRRARKYMDKYNNTGKGKKSFQKRERFLSYFVSGGIGYPEGAYPNSAPSHSPLHLIPPLTLTAS